MTVEFTNILIIDEGVETLVTLTCLSVGCLDSKTDLHAEQAIAYCVS
jgi:hypothetical protein